MQAHIDASLDAVWGLVGNPATYPDWWPVAVEIRGVQRVVGRIPISRFFQTWVRSRRVNGSGKPD
jgi:hypothetical protein